jgi:hypothetical protein
LGARISQTLKSILLLAGSFTFAFLIGETAHEFGHYLAHLIYHTPNVRVHLDPFGGSHIAGVTTLPGNVAAATSAAGPLFNLVLSLFLFLLLLKARRPTLLPLLLWGPVAMVQEGVTFSLGLLTPGGDARWIAAGSGIPQPLILTAGIFLLMTGLGVVALLLPNAGVETIDPPARKLWIVLAGMCSLMFVRFIFSAIGNAASTVENLVPLVFSLILAVIVVLLQPVLKPFTGASPSRRSMVTWRASALGLTLGAGIFLFQILVLN